MPHILSIATALPAHCLVQENIATRIADLLQLDERRRAKLHALYRNCFIETRHTVLDDFLGPSCPFAKRTARMGLRNALFVKHAPSLAIAAAKGALADWGADPVQISHVISVTCTGVFAPGLEFSLVEALGLKRSVERLGMNFMGCFGAFRALSVAAALAKEDPSHRILIVCTELCSLHYRHSRTWDTIVTNALFGDGAAACIVGSGQRGIFSIERRICHALQGSFEAMQWQASDEGLVMTLSKRVPHLLRDEIARFSEMLLRDYGAVHSCDWPIHPGGRAILDAVASALNLEEKQLSASRAVLQACGNISSATFLFVLQKLLQYPSSNSLAAGLGFGPGLSLEGILLRRQ